MQLDHDICERARLARDARFDGRFFIGVKTTGVYCRPVCPVRAAKAENVRYFPTAAAAAEAGFRPCLRCRPEAAPGTPAWIGTAATVSALAVMTLYSKRLAVAALGGKSRWVDITYQVLGFGGALLLILLGGVLFVSALGASRPL